MRQFINIVEAAQAVTMDTLRAKRSQLYGALEAAREAFEANRSPETLKAYQDAERVFLDFKHEMLAHYGTQHLDRPETPVPDYAGQHAAPNAHAGSPLWDVTLNGIYPADFYQGRSRDYVNDPDAEGPMLSVVRGAHKRPNLILKIYRAIPKGLPRKINPGDWVAPLRRYAVEHGQTALNDDYVIVSKTVHARDIFTEGNSLAEWGYDPQPVFPSMVISRKAPTSLD